MTTVEERLLNFGIKEKMTKWLNPMPPLPIGRRECKPISTTRTKLVFPKTRQKRRNQLVRPPMLTTPAKAAQTAPVHQRSIGGNGGSTAAWSIGTASALHATTQTVRFWRKWRWSDAGQRAAGCRLQAQPKPTEEEE
jgi:hypothetical protein